MKQMRITIALAICAMLVACGSGSGSEGDFPSVPDGGGGSVDTSDSSRQSDGSDCTFVLDSNIRSPTRLVNTASDCDYFLTTRRLEVSSLLIIEPGTVIRSDSNASIVVDRGELSAIGTADQRIVFEGVSSVQGYWRGIRVEDAMNVVMDYVDVKDAGQICSVLLCPDVGLLVSDTTLSFTNSSVSNSFVSGMSISDSVQVDAFGNNRFYGNRLAGLAVPIETVPELDEASDYFGIERANGNPVVDVVLGEQASGEIFRWKALNAPYLISILRIRGGILQLDPGVELVFESNAEMDVQGNGVLQALGTATDPVIFRGSEARPGHWRGLRMTRTNFETHILQHTNVSHAGNIDSVSPTYAALRLEQSFITLSNTTFSDNAEFAIICQPQGPGVEASVIVDGGGNRFSNNELGAFLGSGSCSIR